LRFFFRWDICFLGTVLYKKIGIVFYRSFTFFKILIEKGKTLDLNTYFYNLRLEIPKSALRIFRTLFIWNLFEFSIYLVLHLFEWLFKLIINLFSSPFIWVIIQINLKNPLSEFTSHLLSINNTNRHLLQDIYLNLKEKYIYIKLYFISFKKAEFNI